MVGSMPRRMPTPEMGARDDQVALIKFLNSKLAKMRAAHGKQVPTDPAAWEMYQALQARIAAEKVEFTRLSELAKASKRPNTTKRHEFLPGHWAV